MRWSLGLAAELGKPAVIHVREAFEAALALLDEADPGVPIVMHCFSGDVQAARECATRGYAMGIGGPVTYPRSASLREAVAEIPRERGHYDGAFGQSPRTLV